MTKRRRNRLIKKLDYDRNIRTINLSMKVPIGQEINDDVKRELLNVSYKVLKDYVKWEVSHDYWTEKDTLKAKIEVVK